MHAFWIRSGLMARFTTSWHLYFEYAMQLLNKLALHLQRYCKELGLTTSAVNPALAAIASRASKSFAGAMWLTDRQQSELMGLVGYAPIFQGVFRVRASSVMFEHDVHFTVVGMYVSCSTPTAVLKPSSLACVTICFTVLQYRKPILYLGLRLLPLFDNVLFIPLSMHFANPCQN